jgi:hypothetical protein
MMGLGIPFTPSGSGKVLITVTGTAQTVQPATAAAAVILSGQYGVSPVTTVAAGSDGANIANITTLAVASTASLPTSGTAVVQTTTGTATITYTGTTGTSGDNQLTGCTLVSGGGTVHTGDNVIVTPANGTPVSGQRFGGTSYQTLGPGAAIAAGIGFAVTDIVTFTPGTNHWVDLAVATGNTNDAASVASLSVTLTELPS